MPDITEAMLARMPKAVRDRLESLEQQNRQLLDDLQTAHGQAPPGNNTWVAEDADYRPLGRCPRVRFETTTGRITCYIDLEGQLRVSGDWSIIVRPQAGNSLLITPEEV